jgi:hypothetical protein
VNGYVQHLIIWIHAVHRDFEDGTSNSDPRVRVKTTTTLRTESCVPASGSSGRFSMCVLRSLWPMLHFARSLTDVLPAGQPTESIDAVPRARRPAAA